MAKAPNAPVPPQSARISIDTQAVATFKRLYERDLGENIDALRMGTEYSYARVMARLAVQNSRSSHELQAAAQRIRIALGRATVIDLGEK